MKPTEPLTFTDVYIVYELMARARPHRTAVARPSTQTIRSVCALSRLFFPARRGHRLPETAPPPTSPSRACVPAAPLAHARTMPRSCARIQTSTR